MPTRYTYDQYSRRLSENELYQRVYEEIESGQMDIAAQARAIEEGGGDDGAVKSAYIKHRIENIKAEIEIALELAERQREKERQEQEQRNLEEKEKRLRKMREDAEHRRQAEVLKVFKIIKNLAIVTLKVYLIVLVFGIFALLVSS